jgi:hypothetical protein
MISCPLCKRQPKVEGHATISRFLSYYCELNARDTQTLYCSHCDFAYFERRLSEVESTKLYTAYRGQIYNEVRTAFEPGYAPLITLFDDQLSSYYTDRVREYSEIFQSFPEFDPSNIFDIGGGWHFTQAPVS